MKQKANMYVEIGCFVICLVGWMLVCSTLPTEYWKYSTVDQLVLTTGHFFSNLWKDCTTDSTGMSDCKEFPSLLGLDLYIHMCRALIITAIILGFFGNVLALVGMKCTKIGGSDVTKARVTFAAGLHYLISGLCAMIAYSWYGNNIRSHFVSPIYRPRKSEIGAAVFIGWGGTSLLIIGGCIYTFLVRKEAFPPSSKAKPRIPSHLPAQSRLMSPSLKAASQGRWTKANTTFSMTPTDTYV